MLRLNTENQLSSLPGSASKVCVVVVVVVGGLRVNLVIAFGLALAQPWPSRTIGLNQLSYFQNDNKKRLEKSPQPDKISLYVDNQDDPRGQRIIIERRREFINTSPDKGPEGRKCDRESDPNIISIQAYERLQKDLGKTEAELENLKKSHGKLQQVLSEKGSELSHAVRKAEAYQRELKTLRHKLDDMRTKRQKSKDKERPGETAINEINTNIQDMGGTKNLKEINKEVKLSPTMSGMIFQKDIHDKVKNSDDNTQSIYNIPLEYTIEGHTKDSFSNSSKDVENKNVANLDDTGNNKDNIVMHKKETIGCTENEQELKKELELDKTKNSGDMPNDMNLHHITAIYATVDLEMKKNPKKETGKLLNIVETNSILATV